MAVPMDISGHNGAIGSTWYKHRGWSWRGHRPGALFLHKDIGDHAIAIQIGLLVGRLLVHRLQGHRGHLVIVHGYARSCVYVQHEEQKPKAKTGKL